MNEHRLGCLIVLGAVAVLIAYIAHSKVDNVSQPREAPTMTSLNAALDACTEHEFFRPHHATANQQLGFTPHRYPNVTGGNVSTVIHHGMDALKHPAPQDRKWIERPPAEVMY